MGKPGPAFITFLLTTATATRQKSFGHGQLLALLR